ncbi:MAG: hypothetical protein Q9183_000733 [Haloplaca sp. 2 TL-2023]
MFLLIGSNAMQMLALRNEFTAFSRRADAKIGLLKEVIERVQRGEEVDVKGLLGTGDPEKENEWEQVIKELEEEDRLWQSNARRRQKKEEAQRSGKDEKPKSLDSEPSSGQQETGTAPKPGEGDRPSATPKAPPGFY